MKELTLALILGTSLLTTPFLQGKRLKQSQVSSEKFDTIHLPPPIFAMICEKLSPRDRLCFEKTCRQFREIGQDLPLCLKITNSHLQPKKFESLLQFLTTHKIHTLNFSGTNINDNQLDRILKIVGNSLQSLNLFCCFKLINFSSIANCINLHRLNLVDLGNIDDAQLAWILDRIGKSLIKLNLGRCCHLTNFSPIAQCKNLEKLNIYDTQVNNSQVKEILTQIGEKLISLNLAYCERFLKNFTPIANCRNLQILNLSGNKITDDQLAYILDAIGGNLRVLSLNYCKNLTDFTPIINCTNLQTLDLSGNNITVDQLANILAAIGGNLRVLSLNYCKNLTDFTSIANCPNLQELNLSSYNITDKQLTYILSQIGKRLRTLKLNLEDCRPLTNFSPIINCTNLQTLDLSGNKITDDQLAYILDAIVGSLRTLKLYDCENLSFGAISRMCRERGIRMNF